MAIATTFDGTTINLTGIADAENWSASTDFGGRADKRTFMKIQAIRFRASDKADVFVVRERTKTGPVVCYAASSNNYQSCVLSGAIKSLYVCGSNCEVTQPATAAIIIELWQGLTVK